MDCLVWSGQQCPFLFVSLFNPLYKNAYCLRGLDWKVDILNNYHREVIRNENNKTKRETMLVKILQFPPS